MSALRPGAQGFSRDNAEAALSTRGARYRIHRPPLLMEMQVTAEASCGLLERAAGVASTVAKTPFFTFCLTIPYYHYTEHFTGGAPHRSLAGQHLPCIILSPWCSSGLLSSEMRILPKATGLM